MEENLNSLLSRTRTISNDPQYFGGYLNMARLNIFNISNYIGKLFSQSQLDDDDHIANSFLTNETIKNLNWNHVFSKALRFLPIVKLFDLEEYPREIIDELGKKFIAPNETKDFHNMRKSLKLIFSNINNFRNDYSHFYSTISGTNRKLEIEDDIANLLRNAFTFAISHTKLRLKEVLKEEDFNLVSEKKMVEEGNKITTEGLVFLICMFLEREHAFHFIKRIIGFRGNHIKSFVATHEVFMTFCVKLPHDKLISEDYEQRLAMDMVKELNNCPKDLYRLLTERERAKLRYCSPLIGGNHNDVDQLDYDSYREMLVSNIRHRNRFFYFALRFIDETNCFPTLRFHIDIGKLELVSYLKSFAGSEEERRIVVDVKTFGKLSEFVEEDTLHKKIDKNGYTTGFDQFSPRYNFKLNKIGIRKSGTKFPIILPTIVSKSDQTGNIKIRLKQYAPDAFLSLHMLPQIILIEYLERGASEKVINDFINKNKEILDKKFIQQIKGELPTDWAKFQKRSDSKKRPAYDTYNLKSLTDRKQYLNDVLEKHNLNVKQIPTRVLEYWLNLNDVDGSQLFSNRIKLMKKECTDRLKVIEKSKINPNIRTPKVGEMATFLAKDIVDMIVDSEIKSQCSSFYYHKLQKSLAFYATSDEKKIFSEIKDELKLIGTGGHPFLSRVLDKSPINTLEFYIYYLKEKADTRTYKTEKNNSWIEKTFYTTVKDKKTKKRMVTVRMPENASNIPYTIQQWAKIEKSKLDDWLNNILNNNKKPLDLPANLFDAKLLELLSQELNQQNIAFKPDDKWNELFKKWWNFYDRGVQWFYNSEREYNIYDEKINFSPNTKESFKEYYKSAFQKINELNQREGKKPINDQLERLFKRSIAGSEKRFRILQEEDMLKLLMVEKLTTGSDVSIKNLQLSNVEELWNEIIPVEMKLKYDKKDKVISNKSTDPSKTITIKTECKRKNYTTLYKYRYDKRLPGLTEYYPNQKITEDCLKEQLNSYNDAKLLLFDLVFKLEQHIIEYDKDSLIKQFVDDSQNPATGYISHKVYLGWMLDKKIITEEEHCFLSIVRNKFSHNQFPRKEDIKNMCSLEGTSQIAKQIIDCYTLKVNNLISYINKNPITD